MEKNRKIRRTRTRAALKRALHHLSKEKEQSPSTQKVLKAVEEALKDLASDSRIENIYLHRFISETEVHILKQENIHTVYDVLFSDLRQLRTLLRRDRGQTIPLVLVYFHSEKKSTYRTKKSL